MHIKKGKRGHPAEYAVELLTKVQFVAASPFLSWCARIDLAISVLGALSTLDRLGWMYVMSTFDSKDKEKENEKNNTLARAKHLHFVLPFFFFFFFFGGGLDLVFFLGLCADGFISFYFNDVMHQRHCDFKPDQLGISLEGVAKLVDIDTMWRVKKECQHAAVYSPAIAQARSATLC